MFNRLAMISLGVLIATGGTNAGDNFKIAFGSCAKEREEQPIWLEIIATNPDLFLFIGDNQYADLWMKDGKMVMAPVEDISRIREAYAELGSKPGYQRLQRHCPIMATWDDHDFGANDGGRDYPLRKQSQQAFLDFFGFWDTAPIRQQEGIYQARTFERGGHAVQVIMLDTRYHRDTLERGKRPGAPGPYIGTTDTSKTVLGEAQWKWLKKELLRPADVRIIASSIQVVADEHGFETWGNFPHERQRLYDLIDETNASGVLFVSGDRHLMEISRDTGRGADMKVPYPMWDFTSSGLTQRAQAVKERNSYRIGPVRRETNFGVVEIVWGEAGKDTVIHLNGFGDHGQMLTRQTVFLNELREE
ncbi:MAG: alkaline phosphatase D family protein [Phycisphaerae bacterium]